MGAADYPRCLQDALEQMPESLRTAGAARTCGDDTMEPKNNPMAPRRSSQPAVMVRRSQDDDGDNDTGEIDGSNGSGIKRDRSFSVTAGSAEYEKTKVASPSERRPQEPQSHPTSPSSPVKPHQPRSRTSVSLTLRSPSAEPKTPVDASGMSSAASAGLTYRISLPVSLDSGSPLVEISLGRGSALEARIRSVSTSDGQYGEERSTTANTDVTHHRRESSTSSESQRTQSREPSETPDSPSNAPEIWWPTSASESPCHRFGSLDSTDERRSENKDDDEDDGDTDTKESTPAPAPVVRLAPFDNVSTMTWRRPDASTGAIPKSRRCIDLDVIGKTRSVSVPRTLSFQQLPQLEIAIPSEPPDADLVGLQIKEGDAPLLVTAASVGDRTIFEEKEEDEAKVVDEVASSASSRDLPEAKVDKVDESDSGEVTSEVNEIPGEDAADNDDEVEIDEEMERRAEQVAEEWEKILSEVEDEYKGEVLQQLQHKLILQIHLDEKLKEQTELEQEVQDLTVLLKEIKQDKTVQQLESEIYQLQLACETMIGQIDQHTNGEVPLGETDVESLQNFCAAQASSSEAVDPKPEAISEPSESTATAVATQATATAISNADEQEETELRWCCKKCTYSNHHLMVECEMCTTPKEGDKQAIEDENKNEAEELIKVKGKTSDILIRVHHNFSPRRKVHN